MRIWSVDRVTPCARRRVGREPTAAAALGRQRRRRRSRSRQRRRRRRARAARGRARGSSGSRTPLPWSAAATVARPSSSQWRVSWTTRSAGLEQLDLACDLVVDGSPERAQRVQVLDLAAGAELGRRRPAAPRRWRRPAATPPPSGRRTPRWRRGSRAARRRSARACSAERMSGSRDDLDERHAGAVVVDERVVGVVDPAAAADVGRLAGVLFDVRAHDADADAVGQVEPAVDVDRLVVLADLVVLRHVGIEVVLAVEDRALRTSQCSAVPIAQGELDCPLVEHRQRAGQPEADRADVGVRFVAEGVAAPAEQLRRRGELAVHLETDDRLPGTVAHGASQPVPRRRRVGAASLEAAATWNITGSPRPARAPARRRAGPSGARARTGTLTSPGGPRGWTGCVHRSERYIVERVGGLGAERERDRRCRRREQDVEAARTRPSKARMTSVRTRWAWP